MLRHAMGGKSEAYSRSKKPASEIELGFSDRFESRLTVVPSHRGLGSVSHRLDAHLQATIVNDNYSELDADDMKNEYRQRLKNSLDALRNLHDVVLIDTPPDLGFLMTTALIGFLATFRDSRLFGISSTCIEPLTPTTNAVKRE